jgi:glycosyl transferase family 11
MNDQMKDYILLSLLFIMCITLIIVIIFASLSHETSVIPSNKTHENVIYEQNNTVSKYISCGIITYKNFTGRMGNHLFQIAATLGFAKKFNRTVKFTKWEHESLFEKSDELNSVPSELELKLETINLDETECFECANDYHMEDFLKIPIINITGHRQNSQYFNFIADDLRRVFTFRIPLKLYVESKMSEITSFPFIGVHVRRGDYINNPVHEICNLHYYFCGINFFRQANPSAHIIILTDDKKWCQENILPQLSNVSITPFDSSYHDFICLTLCQFKVISNSSFAWWACWLDDRNKSEVFAPRPWVNQSCKSSHLIYLPEWHIYDVHKKIMVSS